MIHIPDPLDLPATPETLRHQAKHHVLDPSALRRAFKITGHTPSVQRWSAVIDILLLVTGCGLLVSGIIFFFAFNWAGMNRFIKLGLLELSVMTAAGLAFWLGLQRLEGKIVLTVAAGLVGALLAVYSQIYQTGADSYNLFLGWAALIAGWVVISRFTPLWVIWALLLNLTLLLYWEQVHNDLDGRAYASLFMLNAAALGGWEWAHRYGISWLQSRWAPRLLALMALMALATATLMLILNSDRTNANDPWLITLLFVFMIVSGVMLYIYSQRMFDPFMLIITALSVFTCVNIWLLKLGDFEPISLIVIGGLVIGQTSGIITWVRKRATVWEAFQR